MGKWDDTEKYNLIFMIEVPEKCNQTACASSTDEEIKYRFIFNTSQHDFVRNSSTQLNFFSLARQIWRLLEKVTAKMSFCKGFDFFGYFTTQSL